MIAEVSFQGSAIQGGINLPASKSISNRVLIVHALGNLNAPIHNLSDADDTQQLIKALSNQSSEINAGDGGTTLRFLMACYCAVGAEVILTASEQMKKRPIKPLVDSLLELGADITYTETEGKLPVQIRPSKLKGKHLFMDGEVSSQFISALMLIGPLIPGGLTIEITGEMVSQPYIHMTSAVMKHFGADVKVKGNLVRIAEGKYVDQEFTIEPDWSAASYWYEIAALSNSSEIFLPGLIKNSLQGDSAIVRMMNLFGVETEFQTEGAYLTKEEFMIPEYFEDDFTNCPDLGPALAATCSGINITADLHGLKNFRLKESDRAAALQRELYNMNVKTDFCGGSKFKLYHGSGLRIYNKPINTYHDHRIAMAFAPLALKSGKVLIDNYDVVKKSYPKFYEDLRSVGFEVRYD